MISANELIVTVLGLGYLPVAPGTWGSLGAALAFLAVATTVEPQGTAVVTWLLLGLAVVAGVILGPWATRYYGEKDPSPFVLDEAAGMWVALIAIPFPTTKALLLRVLAQFLLFRAADIIKPFPARRAEALPHGWGIVADDIIAGLYANIAGQIIFRAIVP